MSAGVDKRNEEMKILQAMGNNVRANKGDMTEKTENIKE
jgi:hypothetical protein